MTKRHAPRTCFGRGLPFGSAVRAKSRFRLYSLSPIRLKLTTDYPGERRFFLEGLVGRDGARPSRNSAILPPRAATATTLLVSQRFADEIARETADHDVLTELRGFFAEQIFDRLIPGFC